MMIWFPFGTSTTRAFADRKGAIIRMISEDDTYRMGTTCSSDFPVEGILLGSRPMETGAGSFAMSAMGTIL